MGKELPDILEIKKVSHIALLHGLCFDETGV